MNKLKRLKPYKNVSAFDTIQKIRHILFENDIFMIELVQRKDPLTGICSCRLIAGDEDLRELNIGSNGKGMNTRYALASAYAEFMERLQNGATLWNVTVTPPYAYSQIQVDRDKLQVMAKDFIALSLGREDGIEEIAERYAQTASNPYVIPFREYPSGDTVYFPASLYNKMMGSNGMAAGNTLLEAIIQGLSEIFERVSLKKLFLEPITPPTIDDSWFEGTDVLRRLNLLRQRGIDCKIIDASIGKGLPVIGLLMSKDSLYHIHFGSDPSPITALERCLTEVFQGRTLESLPLFPPLLETDNEKVLADNYQKERLNYTGRVPWWLIAEEPSWLFSGFTHPVSISDEDDMDYYIQILHQMGKKLFVRDTGFLGFPTVRLYVPGLTEKQCLVPENYREKNVPEDVQTLIRRLPVLTEEQFTNLAQSLEEWLREDYGVLAPSDILLKSVPSLKLILPAGTFAGRGWDNIFLIAAIYIMGGLTEQGLELLDCYFSTKKLSTKEVEMLKIRLIGRTMVFLPTEWPQCPDCEICQAKQFCAQKKIDEITNNLSRLQCEYDRAYNW